MHTHITQGFAQLNAASQAFGQEKQGHRKFRQLRVFASAEQFQTHDAFIISGNDRLEQGVNQLVFQQFFEVLCTDRDAINMFIG